MKYKFEIDIIETSRDISAHEWSVPGLNLESLIEPYTDKQNYIFHTDFINNQYDDAINYAITDYAFNLYNGLRILVGAPHLKTRISNRHNIKLSEYLQAYNQLERNNYPNIIVSKSTSKDEGLRLRCIDVAYQSRYVRDVLVFLSRTYNLTEDSLIQYYRLYENIKCLNELINNKNRWFQNYSFPQINNIMLSNKLTKMQKSFNGIVNGYMSMGIFSRHGVERNVHIVNKDFNEEEFICEVVSLTREFFNVILGNSLDYTRLYNENILYKKIGIKEFK